VSDPRDLRSGVAERLRNDDDAWNAFVAAAVAPSFMQTTMWAGTKRANGWQSSRVVAETADGPVGAQLLIRGARLIPFAFGYAPRGPMGAHPLDDDAIRAFTGAVRSAAGSLGLAHVRIDPGQEDPDGQLREAFLRWGWISAPDVQPPVTSVVDLDRPEEAIWEGVHPKWRKSVRRAERDGLTVSLGGSDRIADFHRIHGVSMDRVGLGARTEQSFRDLVEAFEPTNDSRLLFAETPEGVTAATLMLVGWGPQVATLYSGMTADGRRYRANYLLRWHALRLSREHGYASMDLWGLPNERIDHWKSGWGGRRMEFVRAWDLVLHPTARRLIEGGLSLRARLASLRAGRPNHGPVGPE
jgi:peptidoglycan pentaglycine glycine transferase (the first glycine)